MSNPKAKGMQISLGQNVCLLVLIYHEQGLSQDLDSRVSKMDFGGDRVSW